VDAVLSIVDASNLERNLYLVSQVLELGLPTVVALNMTDIARSRGLSIDVAQLRTRLGIPVVEVQANRRIGVDELKRALATAAEAKPAERRSPFPETFQAETAKLQAAWKDRSGELPRYLAERLLLDTSGYLQGALSTGGQNGAAAAELSAARERLAAAGMPVPAVEAQARYGWVAEVLSGVVARPAQPPVSSSDRLDKFLTHKLWGTLVFALLMLVVFSSVFIFADPVMGLIDGWIGSLGEFVATLVPEGPL
jgi:ferrous iron transport protein B